MFPERIYYEPAALSYESGVFLKNKYRDKEWLPIESHNNIEELRKKENKEFGKMKRLLIVGVRKTHKYVPNHKVSDFLVPYTSSGCSAMCLYCYLVCNYNKCSYLRLFVNREMMLDKLIKTANSAQNDLTFEIGSNSDLVLENTITGNLEWTIESFGKNEKGLITLPTKFDMIEPLLNLKHNGRTIIRMSVNPESTIKRIELGTSPLNNRINALNQLCEAGYRVGLLIAPVVLTDSWKVQYSELITTLYDKLSQAAKKRLFIEIIFMTYSFVHNAINSEAFPNAVNLYDKTIMTGRGRGKYCYKEGIRSEAEAFLREELSHKLGGIPVLYIV
jgi:spore photoproduct lyase